MRFWKLAILVLLLVGCAKVPLPAPNGIPMRPNRNYPSVVMVDGTRSCSGVAVSPKAVLTADHCVREGLKATVVPQRGTPIRTLPPERMPSEDLAVLILEDDLPARVKAQLPQIGQSIGRGALVHLLGFGDGSGARVRGYPFYGTNVISDINGFLELNTPLEFAPRGSDNRAAGTQGDSGGPLFTGSPEALVLVGIIHAHDPNADDYTTTAANVTTPHVRAFLRGVAAKHALSISGI